MPHAALTLPPCWSLSELSPGRRAGEILRIYESDFAVETKADRSPLTAADRAVPRGDRARARPPDARDPGVVGGIRRPLDFAERSAWPWFWLVDPLDGTREFIKRNGEFTVNIALIRGHAPALGVVHVPVLDRDYSGCQGSGALRYDGARAPHSIAVRRPAHEPVRVVGSRSHRGDSLAGFLQRVGPHELVAMGSSLKFCVVAEGDADVYPRLGPTSEWDTAAAQAVVEAAGGHVVDLTGTPLRYNRGQGVLNPPFVVYGDPTRPWLRCLNEGPES